jgi:hypothetical protein
MVFVTKRSFIVVGPKKNLALRGVGEKVQHSRTRFSMAGNKRKKNPRH